MILLAVLVECGGVAEARAYLATKDGPRARAALRLLEAHQADVGLALSVLRQVSGKTHSDMPSLSPQEWAVRFDHAVATSPEASVALYSLAAPILLAEATREMVALITRFDLLLGRPRVLEIGCGIGRFAAALAGSVEHYTGIDVSAGMIENATCRCAGCGNVALHVTSGRDLGAFETSSFGLVLAIDVFPYLVASDDDLACRHIDEAARVLAPGGALLLMNYSYGGDLDRDRDAVAAAAARAGLVVRRNGARDTEIWDGVTFLLAKPS